MWERGLVDEVRRLEAAGLRQGRTASRALRATRRCWTSWPGSAPRRRRATPSCEDAQVRAASGHLVPTRPAHHLAAVRRSGPAGPGAGRRPVAHLTRGPDVVWSHPDRRPGRRTIERVSFPYVKGHGTRNDFVVLPDLDGSVHGDLDPAVVVALCDRRAGLGADGVLRVLRGDLDGGADWFMDYRNADGSVSEMCGNGVRVFARYLADAGLVDPGAGRAARHRHPRRDQAGDLLRRRRDQRRHGTPDARRAGPHRCRGP